MTSSRGPERAFRLNTRPLIAGGVFMGLGGVLGLAGIVVSGASLARRHPAARHPASLSSLRSSPAGPPAPLVIMT
jgi:hypothetical protein